MTNDLTTLNKKINIQEIGNEFSQRTHLYQQLEEEGKHTLQHALHAENIKIHTILSRVKEKESFLGKVKRKELVKPFEEIHDIVGIRIVCLFLSDIEKIEKVIADSFDVISIDNKINDTNNSNMFGYMSAHYIVKIKEQFAGFRYDSIKNISFEIQVRTISMDAWANISHFLEYKSETDIPPELKRDFNALSGLFYVADTHFEMFYKEREENQAIITRDIESIINKRENKHEQTLNFDSLLLYIKNKFIGRRHYANNKDISNLVTDLTNNGYNTIQKLDKQIDKGMEALTRYEQDNHKINYYADIGAVRVLLAIVDKEYRNYQYPEASDDMYERYLQYLN